MSDATADPNIGKIFEDRDSRMTGRRIRVLEAFIKTDGWGIKYPAYKVVTVGTIADGNRSSVSAKNLVKRFREVTA